MVAYRHIKPMGMKQRVHHQPLPCKKRPPRFVMVYIYVLRRTRVIFSFSPTILISAISLTLSHGRGAEDHAIRVAGVVVVVTAIGVDIVEVRAVVRRTEPPVAGGTPTWPRYRI